MEKEEVIFNKLLAIETLVQDIYNSLPVTKESTGPMKILLESIYHILLAVIAYQQDTADPVYIKQKIRYSKDLLEKHLQTVERLIEIRNKKR